MENASKALIIAGAILLAILIIGLGVFIYNQAANTVNTSTGVDQLAVRQVNGQFEHYVGRTLSSTAAKSLIDTIDQNNLSGDRSTNIFYDGPAKDEIKLGHRYEVEASYDSGGVITGITVWDPNAIVISAPASKDDLVIKEKLPKLVEEQVEMQECK